MHLTPRQTYNAIIYVFKPTVYGISQTEVNIYQNLRRRIVWATLGDKTYMKLMIDAVKNIYLMIVLLFGICVMSRNRDV